MKQFLYNKKQGQALLLVVIFSTAIFLTIVLGIADPVINEARVSADLVHSKGGLYISESSAEDVMYRLKNNITVSNTETLTYNNYSATTTVTTTINGKTIDTQGSNNNDTRKVEAQVVTSTGADFNYGIQTGVGGFTLGGGSTVNGNIYSNGSIVGNNGATITGSAIAANPPALTADQVNKTPTTPTNSINIGQVSGTQDVAQSFQVSQDSPLNNMEFYIKKVSTPSDISVKIVADSGGKPSTVSTDVIAQGTLSASLVSTSYGWDTVTFTTNPTLDPDAVYWIVLDSTFNASKYYTIGANSSGYSAGQALVGQYGSSSWASTTPANLDTYFQVYLGGGTSTIGGGTYVGSTNVGTGSTGDAWAHTVTGVQVAGNLYCQTGTTNNKTCNTSKGDPVSQALPVSDSNTAEWEAQAETGNTITGDYTVGYAGATIGPAVITGNLTVNGGGTLTLAGTVYVKGSVNVSGGGQVRLAVSYGTNSGVLISDGPMSISGGGSFQGSGQTGSYPLLVTTSDCPVGAGCAGADAIDISGGAGAVILDAQNGTIDMSGGTSAKSLTANAVVLTNGATVTYDSGLANLNFSSGPSGSWSISSWKEVQ